MVDLDMVQRELGKSEAHLHLARAAAAVARARLERGAFPESLAEAMAAPPLRREAASLLALEGRLDLEALERGANEVDDGRTPPSVWRLDEGDIVVELQAPPK
jgi:hypothetical protein